MLHLEITGFTKDEALDLPLVETFIVPNLRKSVHEVMDNALRGQGTSNYELEFRTKDKEIRYLLGERQIKVKDLIFLLLPY